MKVRLDVLLVEKGFAASREKAKAIIMAGNVFVDGQREDKAGTAFDPDTNILTEIFREQFYKLNPSAKKDGFKSILRSIRQELKNDDLGKSFYKRLQAVSPVKLIDFENPQNNTFHFTAEFTCKNGQDEFRPDITLFVNGLPLCFVEVKSQTTMGKWWLKVSE